MKYKLKIIFAFLFLLMGITTYAQKTSFNVFEAIQKPDSIEFLRISCPHHFPDKYPCDSVPKEIAKLKRLKTIDASESRFCCLPETFNQLDSLEAFSLSENYNFRTTEICKLVGLPRLKTLMLSFMYLNELPSCLSQLQNLENVCLNLDKFNYTQAIKVLSKLKNLKYLDISLEQNQEFPNNIQEIKSLLYLRLDYSFVEVKSLVKYCSSMNLQGLGLSNTQLDKLPNDFYKMKSLIGLDLSGNSFDSIPDEILKLRNLKFLSLRDNYHHLDFYLGDDISKLNQLEYLDLSDTKINQLPNKITELENLKFLNLHYSNVQNMTSIIPKMKGLKHLNIDINNNIEDIKKLRELCPNLIITDLPIGKLENSDGKFLKVNFQASSKNFKSVLIFFYSSVISGAYLKNLCWLREAA